MSAIPKFNYLRSKPLMLLYRTIPCQRCGIDNGTVVGAHSNQGIHGKARGLKSSDEFCASLCADCHAWLDYGNAKRADKVAAWNDAHIKTVETLKATYGDKYTNLIMDKK